MFDLYFIYQVKSYSSENLIHKLNDGKIVCRAIDKIEDYTYQIKIHLSYNKKFLKLFKDAILIEKHGLLFDVFNMFCSWSSIISLIISIISFCFFNTRIFKVDIYGKNPNLSTILERELYEYNIKKYSKIPNFSQLLDIKNNIINKHDDIESMELISVGTSIQLKYFLKEDEVLKDSINQKYYASKSGIIKSSNIERGNFLFSINDYVKKGELLIDDYIYINDKSIYVGGYGKVYAYTWSIVEINQASTYDQYINNFNELLNKSRYEISKSFSEEEYIYNESILINKYENNMLYLKIHYTCVENIAKN